MTLPDDQPLQDVAEARAHEAAEQRPDMDAAQVDVARLIEQVEKLGLLRHEARSR